jgi:cytochrome c-type biogenesis protein CcmH/NrfF
MSEAFFLPLAHAGHWIWLLYVPPVAIVVFAIVRTTIAERRKERQERQERGESKRRGSGRDPGQPPG